jgi:hypothetical protein
MSYKLPSTSYQLFSPCIRPSDINIFVGWVNKYVVKVVLALSPWCASHP